MATLKSKARSAATWEMARRQHWVVTHADMRGLGFSAQAIKRRVASGRLHRVYRGVYAVGRPQLTHEGRWMAAVRACGNESALSHRSAAALWGIGTERTGLIDVSVRSRRESRHRGIRARIRPALSAKEVVTRQGIPTTSPAQTLIDLATELSPVALERAINDADKRDLIDPEALRESLERHRGEPGVRKLRAVLDPHSFRLSDSDLEIYFRKLATATGLPPPLTKEWVDGFEVDFYWPDLDLVVETDGLQYHRTPAAQARDRVRDQTHTAAGRTILRFTHDQVEYEAKRTAALFARTVELAREHRSSRNPG